MLERKSVNICWVQVVRYAGMEVESLFRKQHGIGYSIQEMKKEVGILLAKIWVVKVMNSKISDRMIVTKVLT